MKWFRLYHDIIDDPKIGLMSESEQLLWFRLLCLASMSDERGTIAMTDDELCFRLRISVEFWRCTKEKFRCKGLIDYGQSGSIKITHWDEHQYESDSSASRVARHRAKKKKEACNVTAPLPELLPKRFSDGQDPDPDPDSDSEERKKEPNLPLSQNASLAEPVAEQLPASFSNQAEPLAASNSGLETKDPAAPISPKKEKPRDPMGDRFRAGAKVHRYPALVEAGFGAIWVGPGFRDFDPAVVRAACRHKTKNKLADEYVDGQTYIANAIRDENWAAIEMLVTTATAQSKTANAPTYEALPIEPIPVRSTSKKR